MLHVHVHVYKMYMYMYVLKLLTACFSIQAFWYTATKGNGGPVFGNNENFIGLGVIIDTFDNNGVVRILL